MATMPSSAIMKMILYFEADVKRINHALKVYTFAKSMAELEEVTEEKLQIIELASILHDIGIKESEKKYSSASGKYQQIEGPPVAEDLLSDFNIDRQIIDRICYLIGNHHTYTRIDDIDFQILVEADFLVNIFEDNLSPEQISIIKHKYFKTPTGLAYLDSMFNEVKEL